MVVVVAVVVAFAEIVGVASAGNHMAVVDNHIPLVVVLHIPVEAVDHTFVVVDTKLVKLDPCLIESNEYVDEYILYFWLCG